MTSCGDEPGRQQRPDDAEGNHAHDPGPPRRRLRGGGGWKAGSRATSDAVQREPCQWKRDHCGEADVTQQLRTETPRHDGVAIAQVGIHGDDEHGQYRKCKFERPVREADDEVLGVDQRTCSEAPSDCRVLNEAETAAPLAHRKHFKILADRYLVALERAVKRGEIRNFDRDELETVAYMMMAARSYLYLRYVKGNERHRKLPEKVVKAYMKIIRGGLS